MNENNSTDFSALYPVISEQLACGGSVRFTPHGYSMLPFIRQGIDEVVLSKADVPLRKNDIIFYRRANGQFVLHRIVGKGASSYILRGDNQTRLEYGITDESVIGVVSEVVRNGKTILRGSPAFWYWGRVAPLTRRIARKLRSIKNKLLNG